MPTLKTTSTLSDEERWLYQDAYLATWHTISAAIEVLLMRLDDVTLSLVERLGLKTELARLEMHKTIVDECESAFRYKQAAISPPSMDMVNQARNLTDQVQALVNNSHAAGRAIELARQAFELFAKIQKA